MHQIVSDENGQHGSDGTITVSLLGAGRMFKRRAIKAVGTPAAHEVNWLVVELDGVRVYQSGSHVIVTRQDLNP